MRILCLSPRQCWPTQNGAKLREYYLLRALGQRAEVTHLSFAEAGGGMTATDLPFCRRVVSVPRPRSYSPDKLLRGFFGRWPLPVVNYTSREMRTAIAAALSQPFDLIQLESIHMIGYASQLGRATSAPIVYDWHNIESELLFRYSRQSRSFTRARYAALTARRLASLEDRILREAFGHFVCSDRERRELLLDVPTARIAVIENGVDAAFFAGPALPQGRRRIVFVGHMAYHANIEAAIGFAREIWPGLHRAFPQWSLTIVGSNPTPPVLALQQDAGIEVTGTVPDVRPFYREAVAAIVPLRVGGGTRLKILEAMAAGVPVVSTSLGAEGLAVVPGRDLFIAENPGGWQSHLQSLSSNPDRWTALSAAGRELVRTRYDWESLGKELYDTYSEWLAAAQKPTTPS